MQTTFAQRNDVVYVEVSVDRLVTNTTDALALLENNITIYVHRITILPGCDYVVRDRLQALHGQGLHSHALLSRHDASNTR